MLALSSYPMKQFFRCSPKYGTFNTSNVSSFTPQKIRYQSYDIKEDNVFNFRLILWDCFSFSNWLPLTQNNYLYWGTIY